MDEANNQGAEKRDFYRIKYPEAEQPTLHIGKSSFQIIDLSEQGIRFQITENTPFQINKTVKVSIQIKKGEKLTLRGYLQFDTSTNVLFLVSTEYQQLYNKAHEQNDLCDSIIEINEVIFDIISTANDKISIKDQKHYLLKSIQNISAQIKFADDDTIDIKGQFIRSDGIESIMLLSLSIPFQKVFAEQLKLKNKYAGYLK